MRSALTVILTLVIGGLTSVILVVLGVVNLQFRGFSGNSAGKESTCNAGDPGSIGAHWSSIGAHSSILGLPHWLRW